MLRILGRDRNIAKSTATATRSESQIDTYDVLEGLSSWEFVNPSDDEQDDHLSFSDDLDHTVDDQELLKQEGSFDLEHFDDKKMCKQENPCSFGSAFTDIPMKSLSLAQITGSLFVNSFEADDDDSDEDDLDDELVPKWLSDKFGRQRIRKVGKRACSRMNKSKRVPYYYNRPGCVRGKHGLGVQHSYI